MEEVSPDITQREESHFPAQTTLINIVFVQRYNVWNFRGIIIMLNELEELAPTNAATFNGVTLIVARARTSIDVKTTARHIAKVTIVFPV